MVIVTIMQSKFNQREKLVIELEAKYQTRGNTIDCNGICKK